MLPFQFENNFFVIVSEVNMICLSDLFSMMWDSTGPYPEGEVSHAIIMGFSGS